MDKSLIKLFPNLTNMEIFYPIFFTMIFQHMLCSNNESYFCLPKSSAIISCLLLVCLFVYLNKSYETYLSFFWW